MAFRARDTVLSGVLILAALFVLGLSVYLVKGGKEQFQPKVRYTVVFTNSGGLGGGDDVLLDGQKVGRVVYTERDEERRRVDVFIEVGKTVGIPASSQAIVTKSVTGVVGIEIMSGRSDEMLPAGAEIPGALPRSFVEIQAALGEIGERFGSIRRKFGEVVAAGRAAGAEFDFGPVGTNWRELTAALDRARAQWTPLADDLRAFGPVGDDLARGLDEARALGREVGDDMPGLADRFEAARGNLGGVGDELKDIGARFRELGAEFGDALDRLDAATARFPVAMKTVREAIVEAKPQVRRVVEDADAAFAKFQTLQGDLMRAPWKLLNKPSADEVTAIHRFNALRLYIEAATEVSRTLEGIETLRRLGFLADPDEAEMIADVFRRLQRTLAEFDARQRRVVELLVEEQAAGAK